MQGSEATENELQLTRGGVVAMDAIDVSIFTQALAQMGWSANERGR